MTFGEKLYKLRKGRGFSQETLAGKLNTSRQAISKWENGQGYPETEKLLIIGSIFEVSLDYLLKDSVQQSNEEIEGYYVSKEMAEGYLVSIRKSSTYIACGVLLIALSVILYFIFQEDLTIYTFLVIIIIATLGVGLVIAASYIEEERYKVLKKEPLFFDEIYLKELTRRYEEIKIKYTPIMLVGISSLVLGVLAFFLEKKEIAMGILVPYYPVFTGFIAIGLFILVRYTAILDAYKLLARNEEHARKLGFRIRKKVRRKVDKHL